MGDLRYTKRSKNGGTLLVNKKTWIIFIAICVILFGGLIYLSQKGKVDVSSINVNKIQPASAADGHIGDHVYGNAKSPVKFIEYGDYQCPFCGEANPQVQQVMDAYKDQIAYIFRNFPLTTMHPNALAAAAAAEAAGLQGKYWPMHEKLYEMQNDWAETSGADRTNKFIEYASELGLKTDQFKTDLDSPRITKKINFDRAIVGKIGITATPSFYLNGKKIPDSITQSLQQGQTDKLEAQINALLKENHITPPKPATKK